MAESRDDESVRIHLSVGERERERERGTTHIPGATTPNIHVLVNFFLSEFAHDTQLDENQIKIGHPARKSADEERCVVLKRTVSIDLSRNTYERYKDKVMKSFICF